MNLGPMSTSWLEDKLLRLVKVIDEGYHPKEDTRDDSLRIIWRMGKQIPQGTSEGHEMTVKTSENTTLCAGFYSLNIYLLNIKIYRMYLRLWYASFVLYIQDAKLLNIQAKYKSENAVLCATLQSKELCPDIKPRRGLDSKSSNCLSRHSFYYHLLDISY